MALWFQCLFVLVERQVCSRAEKAATRWGRTRGRATDELGETPTAKQGAVHWGCVRSILYEACRYFYVCVCADGAQFAIYLQLILLCSLRNYRCRSPRPWWRHWSICSAFREVMVPSRTFFKKKIKKKSFNNFNNNNKTSNLNEVTWCMLTCRMLFIYFLILPDDALKRMECENNLKMFTAIAHLQVLHHLK